jgi:hypothetical protein
LYIVVLINYSVLPGGFTCLSLLEFLGSLPFRLCYYWLIAFKELRNLDRVSVSLDCGCKSTHFFFPRNTFCEKILIIFLWADYQSVVTENFSRKASKSLEVRHF